jgi:antitoxin component YwqK of YwqJK toxin-antitoxin module
MKYLLFLLLSVSCLAQNEFNKLDENGKKNGVWKGYYEESKRQRYEGTFDHGIETGTFIYFDDTKVNLVIATRTFSENGTVAYTILYDRNKNIVSEGKTVNRLNEGEWKYYQEASKDLMSVENFVKGKLSGLKKVFYKNNVVAEESNYLNGLKNGSYKKYTEKGIVLEESNFKNGEYEGLVIFRDALGNITAKGPYVNGLKKGKWQFFVNGKLKKEEVWPIVKYVAKHKRKQS